MSTGITVHPWGPSSLAVVTPPSTAVASPVTETRPPAMDKAEFRKLLDHRLKRLTPPQERSFPSFVGERFTALMRVPEPTQEAEAELYKALAAEDQRRKDAEAARKAVLDHIELAISEFEREHPQEALSALEAYLKDLEQRAVVVSVYTDEMKKTTAKINRLKSKEEK